MFAVRYSNAADVAHVIQELLGGKQASATVVAEPTSNSILMSASSADVARAKEILAKIDRLDAAADDGRVRLRVYELANVDVSRQPEWDRVRAQSVWRRRIERLWTHARGSPGIYRRVAAGVEGSA